MLIYFQIFKGMGVKRFILLFFVLTTFIYAMKIKDISNVVGVRENQLIGYGLVVGLEGTGDGGGSAFTLQSLANMLETMNIKVHPNDINSKNVAAVIVTANIPAFARQGDRIDMTISSIGDAKSLEGGTLLLTPLKGVDGEIYALGQGSVSIGGRNGRGGGDRNHATAGKVPMGATIERDVAYDLYSQQTATLSLKTSNFQNAIAIQDILNRFFADRVAAAVDPRTIRLQKPDEMSMVEFLATVQELSIDFSQTQKIVIDERTGTIVAGVDITVQPVVITHKDITIKIEMLEQLPEPNDGNIRMGNDINIGLATNSLQATRNGSTVANIARSLQRLGAEPTDIIAILEAMKRAGAIQADLEVI